MKENLWRILQITNEWVRYSDTKAVALLGIQGVLLGFIVNTISEGISPLTIFRSIIISIGFLLNLISMLYAFLCLNPKLKMSGGISPLYFGSIANAFQHSDEYYEHVKNTFKTEEQIAHELCGQIFINSQIANRKFHQATSSLRYFISSFLFWSILLISMI